jgi:ATP-dependent Clp protease protease subunit
MAKNTKSPQKLQCEEQIEVELEEDELALSAPKTVALIKLYGTVNEDRCEDVIDQMLRYVYTGGDLIQFMISTHGGLVSEMFSVYDIMRVAREDAIITTLGLGKVMSAGVLLLAAGTKGYRQIGANCQIMIHSLKAEQGGYISTMNNDLEHLKSLEERYIRALSKETNMSKKYIRKLFDKKLDVFLTAEEAVDLGIADEII